MKLKKGQQSYKFPEYSQIFLGYIKGRNYDRNLCYISSQFPSPHYEGLGIPHHFSIVKGRIYFYPIPDKAYTVKIRYAPSAKEF